MNEPLYKFVNGNGDSSHQHQINEVAKQGFEVSQVVFDPDGRGDNKRLVVLMHKTTKPAL